MSELLKIDNEYARWVEEISHNFKKFQIKASASVNVEMLKFYCLFDNMSNLPQLGVESINSTKNINLPQVGAKSKCWCRSYLYKTSLFL